VKALALSASANGPFLFCNEQTVRDRTYPLTRSIFFQMNRPPGTPLPPKIKEFLLYILSREGQDAVAAQGEYLPLTLTELVGQRKLLN
jgi:phosphate transport system substrate-binding protein